jgi:quercetin dioxygenase-like cupin family protein
MTLATETIGAIPQHLPVEAQEQLVVMGQRLTIRVTPAQSNGACMVFDMIADPGLGVPMHVHDHEDELFIVRSGAARFVVNGREIILEAGDTLFGPRGVPHAWEAIGDEPLDASVTILPGRLETMFRELGALSCIDPAKVGAICSDHGVRFI